MSHPSDKRVASEVDGRETAQRAREAFSSLSGSSLWLDAAPTFPKPRTAHLQDLADRLRSELSRVDWRRLVLRELIREFTETLNERD